MGKKQKKWTLEKGQRNFLDLTTISPLPPDDKTVLFKFPTSYEMNMTMFRLQEFYESPRFAGERFSVEEYMDWYAYTEHARERKSPDAMGFDYLTRVLGLNIPGPVVANFFRTFDVYEDDCTDREYWLHGELLKFLGGGDFVKGLDGLYGGDFYVIAVYGEKQVALRHEVAHAYYALDPAYRKLVDGVLKDWHRMVPSAEKALEERGYASSVFDDEFHAFCLDSWADWFPKWYYIPGSKPFVLRQLLRTEIQTHYPKLWSMK